MRAITCSASLAKLAPAMVKAQRAMRNAIKDAKNPHFKSMYATLQSVLEAVKEPLADNGLALVQSPSGTGEYAGLVTMLLHESGEWLQGEMTLATGNAGPQGAVSSVTYARRTAVLAMCGIAADEDDDGEAAQPRGEWQRPPVQAAASHAPAQKPLAPRAPSGGSGAVFPPFGRSKGQPVDGASAGDLEFYGGACRRTLADMGKAKWHDKERELLAAIDREMLRQGLVPAGFEGQEPERADDGLPF